MPTPPDDPLTPTHWTEQFLKTARKINDADTGAIAAAAGGAFVFGLITGGWGWIPLGGFAAALLHRSYKHFEKREVRHTQQRIQIAALERKELEAIAKSKLPEAQKKYLIDKLTATEASPPDERKQLPP